MKRYIYSAVAFDINESLDAQIREFKDQLISYGKTKIENVYKQANDELHQVVRDNIGDTEFFNDCLNTHITDLKLNSVAPTVIPELEYCADEDGRYTWINIFYVGDNPNSKKALDALFAQLDFPDDCGQYFLGEDENCVFEIVPPNVEDFITYMTIILIVENKLNVSNMDSIIPLGKQLIDGYCDFVRDYCSNRTQKGLQYYFKHI